MTHELKCWPESFQAIFDGRKKFEVRRTDRCFQTGDTLRLREWAPYGFDPTVRGYTDRELTVKVTFILMPGQFWLGPDVCVMSIDRDPEVVRSEGACMKTGGCFLVSGHVGKCQVVAAGLCRQPTSRGPCDMARFHPGWELPHR